MENVRLNEYRNLWEKVVKVNLGKPTEIKSGKYLLIGIIKDIRIQVPLTGGDEMAFTTLEDYNGKIDLVFFPSFWSQFKNKIKEGEVVALIVDAQIPAVSGKVNSDGRRSFIVCGIQNVDKLLQQTMLKPPNNRINKRLRSSKRKLKN